MCLHLTEKENRLIIKLREQIKVIKSGTIKLNIHKGDISCNMKVSFVEKF